MRFIFTDHYKIFTKHNFLDTLTKKSEDLDMSQKIFKKIYIVAGISLMFLISSIYLLEEKLSSIENGLNKNIYDDTYQEIEDKKVEVYNQWYQCPLKNIQRCSKDCKNNYNCKQITHYPESGWVDRDTNEVIVNGKYGETWYKVKGWSVFVSDKVN